MKTGKPTAIALTGAMGSGKSAALAAFAEAGAKTLDADALAHEALESDPEVAAKVRRVFGEDAFGENGSPDRAAIARMAFADPRKLAELEAAIHPVIEKKWRAECASEKTVVVEIPLLFEKKLEKNFDVCVSVLCSETLRKKRLVMRGMQPEEIKKRDAFQLPPSEKANRADIVIFNESGFDFLKMQAAQVLSRLE